jgi:outer membrane immunogenic protein
MKKLLLASVGVLALGVAAAAAADLPRRMPTKAPEVYMPPPALGWNGLYVGVNGGYGFGRSKFSAPFATGSFKTQGGVVGGTLGYNLQYGQVVFGAEGDIDWSGISGNTVCGGVACNVKNNWLGTARGRIGYSFDRFLPYFTGGVAFGNIKTSIAGVGTSNTTRAGWTIGGGVEGRIYGPWTAKVEYLYVDLGRGGMVGGSNARFTSNIVRGGINYNF